MITVHDILEILQILPVSDTNQQESTDYDMHINITVLQIPGLLTLSYAGHNYVSEGHYGT